VIEWKRVPWPLWAYCAVILLGTISLEVKAHGPIPPKLLFPVVMLTWLYLLLKGVRWVWIITVGVYVLGFVADLISGSLTWEGGTVSLIGLVLLLLPVTRWYFAKHTAVADA
jgi:hypothetical protein